MIFSWKAHNKSITGLAVAKDLIFTAGEDSYAYSWAIDRNSKAAK